MEQVVAKVDPVPRPIDLATLRDIRREMAAVYRDARAGRIPSSDATRLIYCLREIVRVLMGERGLDEQQPKLVQLPSGHEVIPAVARLAAQVEAYRARLGCENDAPIK